MTSAQLMVLIAAVVVVATGFVILRPGDDEDPAPPRGSTTTAEQTEAGGPPTTETKAEAPPIPPEPEFTRIRIQGGQPVGGEAKVSVERGEMIRLAVSSDVDDEVHVHGYDLSKPVGPGAPVRFSFKADIEGIFEVELEQRAVPIAELEVTP